MRLGWVALLSVGCGASFDLDPAPYASSRTLVVVAHDAQKVGQARVYTSSGGLSQSFDVRIAGLDGPALTVLGSSQSAAALRLSPGPLDVDPEGELLPPFPVMRRRSLGGGGWEVLSALPEPLASTKFHRAAPVDPCPRVAPRQIDLASTAPMGWAAAMTSSVALATANGEFFTVGTDLEVTAQGAAHFFYWGLVSVDGKLLVGSQDCVFRAGLRDKHPELGAAVFCDDGLDGNLLIADAQGFAVVGAGSVSFVRAGTATTSRFASFSLEVATLLPTGEVAIAARADPYAVRFAVPGQTWREELDLSVQINGLEWVDGVGLLAGDAAGNVYRRTSPRQWEPLGDAGFFFGAYGFRPVPGGFLVVGGTAEGAVWLSGHGYCPLTTFSAGPDPAMARLGTGYLFLGMRHPQSTGLAATWIDLGLRR